MAAPKGKTCNPKHELFIAEYLKDFNGTRAALAAGLGGTRKSAAVASARLLADDNVKKRIEAAKQKRVKKVQIDAEWVLRRLARLADSNLKNVAEFSNNGLVIKDSKRVGKSKTYQVDSIEVSHTQFGTTKRVKMRSPDKALMVLARHVGVITEDGTINPTPGVEDTEEAFEFIRPKRKPSGEKKD